MAALFSATDYNIKIKPRGMDKVKKLKINWDIADEMPEGFGHGIEVYYFEKQQDLKKFHGQNDTGFLIAFVYGFAWYHRQSDEVGVQVLSPQSAEFTNRALNGVKIIMEMNTHLSSYLSKRELPQRPTQHLLFHLNG